MMLCRCCVEEDWGVIGMDPREMKDSCFCEESLPARIAKESIKTLHDQSSISFVGPRKTWSIETQVKKIACVQTVVESIYSPRVGGGGAKLLMAG
jgi:hypothetical protein